MGGLESLSIILDLVVEKRYHGITRDIDFFIIHTICIMSDFYHFCFMMCAGMCISISRRLLKKKFINLLCHLVRFY